LQAYATLNTVLVSGISIQTAPAMETVWIYDETLHSRAYKNDLMMRDMMRETDEDGTR
jgi:hypothetical protein